MPVLLIAALTGGRFRAIAITETPGAPQPRASTLVEVDRPARSTLYSDKHIEGQIPLRQSARNRRHGGVVEILRGAVTRPVRIKGGGATIPSSIANAAMGDPGLRPGQKVWAVIKASDVMIGGKGQSPRWATPVWEGGMAATTHADKVTAALTQGEAARSALVASWSRSARLHGLDPQRRGEDRLTAAEFAEARERAGHLLPLARPAMERLFQAVGGLGACVMLSDAAGIALDRCGAPSDDPDFAGWGLWTGTRWSEAAQGTNAIGTCLVETRPVTIHRDQHFLTRNTGLSCMSAPVFGATGALAAVLDVSSARAEVTEGLTRLIAGTVAETARRIEADLFRAAYPGDRILMVPGVEGGLLAADADGIVTGATRAARAHLRQSPLGQPVADLLGLGDHDLPGAERAVLARALARHRGNVSAAARALGISRATFHRKLSQG